MTRDAVFHLISKHREVICQSQEGVYHLIRNTYREMIHQTQELFCHLVPVVQKIDSAIHRINHYPMAKYKGNQLLYPVDRADLSDGLRYPPFEQPRPDIQNQEVI